MKNIYNGYDFNKFKNIVLNNKLSYEQWLNYYYAFLEALDYDIKDFDYITNAIYLKHAIILSFENYDEQQKYLNQISLLNTIIEQNKNDKLKR